MEPSSNTNITVSTQSEAVAVGGGGGVPIVPATSTVPQSTQVTSSMTGQPGTVSAQNVPNLITVPVPIVHNDEYYTYVMIKGSLHDRSCSVFGLNEEERQALGKRFESIKPVVNGFMVSTPPVDMVNTLAQLNYKVVASSGEAEICWTMQREI